MRVNLGPYWITRLPSTAAPIARVDRSTPRYEVNHRQGRTRGTGTDRILTFVRVPSRSHGRAHADQHDRVARMQRCDMSFRRCDWVHVEGR